MYELFDKHPIIYEVWDYDDFEEWFVGYCAGGYAAKYFARQGYDVVRAEFQ
jgi:hypothetical protein